MYENLEELKQSFSNCQKCKLCKTRNNIVFGREIETKTEVFLTLYMVAWISQIPNCRILHSRK